MNRKEWTPFGFWHDGHNEVLQIALPLISLSITFNTFVGFSIVANEANL